MAGLLWAAGAQAALRWPSEMTKVFTAQAPAANDDDDEDDAKPAPNKPATPSDAPKKGDAVVTAPAPAATGSSADAQKLVSGAPLYNPNVAVHIVEAKQFSDSKQREVVIYPATVQVNGKFTQHAGSAMAVLWHLHENFALKAWGQYNWYASESSFNEELVKKLRASATPATSLLWTWGALGGVEVTPLYGKFAWYENTLAHFSFVISGGAGAGATRLQLLPADPANGVAARFGQTAPRFLGSLGAGFRLQLGERFAIRLEVTDVVYTARVDRVNGCDGASLKAMNETTKPLNTLADRLNPGCQYQAFQDPDTGNSLVTELNIAKKFVEEGSSDVLNNVGFYAGFSVIF